MKEKVSRIFNNKSKFVNQIYVITALFLLLIFIVLTKDEETNAKLIVDKEGNVVGIEQESEFKSAQIPITIESKTPSGIIKKEVVLKKSPIKSEAAPNKENKSKKEEEVNHQAEINKIIADVELSNKKVVSLPRKLSDGSVITWKLKNEGNTDFVLIIFSYILCIFFLIYNEYHKNKTPINIHRDEILRALPRFTNQLHLMLSAGVILSDSFQKICESYKLLPEEERGYFENSLIEIEEKNSDHRISTADLLRDYASSNNIKELMRITTILLENEKRGSDVVERLTVESKFLWDSRKITALEKGKSIDSKMALPLGLLLTVLMFITMAPAIMGM